MSTTVDNGVKQVLARLLEASDSAAAALASGSGPGAYDITTAAQIIAYFNEGARFLARTPILQIRGTSSVAVSAGTFSQSLDGLTTAPANRTLWTVSSATWTITSSSAKTNLAIVDASWYESYYPLAPTGVPKHVFNAVGSVFLGPTPSADGTLAMAGLLLPKALVSGGNFDDIPDPLLPHLYSFACWRVCEQNAAHPAMAAQLPLWQNEIAPWAGQFLGIGGGK